MEFTVILIHETIVFRRIQATGDVLKAASQFNNNVLNRLELLLLMFCQTNSAVISPASSKSQTPSPYCIVHGLKRKKMFNVIGSENCVAKEIKRHDDH